VGTRYLDAYPCLVVLAIGTTVALWQTPSVGLLYGISRHRFFAGANLLEGLANVILSLVLVRRYGIFGVAVGTCIPMLALKLVAQPYYVCRVSSLSLRDYAMQLCRSVAVALMAIGVPILLTRAYAGPSYVQLLTVGLGSGVSYALVIWFLQLTRQERATMLSALPSWLVPVESVPKEVDSVRRQ
jgi:O-antigen/teichoic acid export membrane protein